MMTQGQKYRYNMFLTQAKQIADEFKIDLETLFIIMKKIEKIKDLYHWAEVEDFFEYYLTGIDHD